MIKHDDDRSQIPLAVRGSAKLQIEASINNRGDGRKKMAEMNRLRIRLLSDTADFIDFTEPCILLTCPNPASRRIYKNSEL